MRIGKIQQQVLSNIDTFQEFELIEYIRGKSAKVKLKCKKCGKVLNKTYKFCTNCGTPFEVENDVNTPRILVSYNSFDPIFKNS